MTDPSKKTSYTCRILDNGEAPIVSDIILEHVDYHSLHRNYVIGILDNGEAPIVSALCAGIM